MALGGNEAFAAFLADPARGVPRHVWMALPLQTRYFTPAADLYRRRMRAALGSEEIEGGSEAVEGGLPVELDPAIRPPPPPRTSQQRSAMRWTPDSEAKCCELCRCDFHLLNWRHHCRKCGRAVCSACSPSESWRPMPGSNGQAERHCKLCVTPTKPMMGMGGQSGS